MTITKVTPTKCLHCKKSLKRLGCAPTFLNSGTSREYCVTYYIICACDCWNPKGIRCVGPEDGLINHWEVFIPDNSLLPDDDGKWVEAVRIGKYNPKGNKWKLVIGAKT